MTTISPNSSPPKSSPDSPEATALFRRHAQRAVEPDRRAVDHLIGNDRLDQSGVFVGPAEPLREGNRGGEGLAGVLAKAVEHRRVEQAGQNGRDATPLP